MCVAGVPGWFATCRDRLARGAGAELFMRQSEKKSSATLLPGLSIFNLAIISVLEARAWALEWAPASKVVACSTKEEALDILNKKAPFNTQET